MVIPLALLFPLYVMKENQELKLSCMGGIHCISMQKTTGHGLHGSQSVYSSFFRPRPWNLQRHMLASAEAVWLLGLRFRFSELRPKPSLLGLGFTDFL